MQPKRLEIVKGQDPARPINLALQGGGAWGAYTWGVLDHLLGRRDLIVDRISGTSAGALNGAIVCSELTRGNAKSARQALESFWQTVSKHPARDMMHLMMGPIGQMVTRQVGEWMWARGNLSPYQADPMDLNPLRAAIRDHVDIEAIRSQQGPQLYVTATNVQTGLPRIFGSAEMSVEALMASACLPQLFRAVEIDGEFYWDGGYCGNPTIWPLIRHSASRDIVLVQLAPDSRAEVPHDAKEIRDRVGEIVFNSSLVAEMQAIHALRELAQSDDGRPSPFSELRLHRIGPPDEEAIGSSSTALDQSWPALSALHEQGLAGAKRFLQRHGRSIGVESTLDIARAFIDPRKPKVNLRRQDQAALV